MVTTEIELNNGVRIPALGLGVWKSKSGAQCRDAVRSALEAGYRHIDSAKIYGNEADVAQAIRESGIPEGEVFITTKLWNGDQGYDSALAAFEASRKKLKRDVVDLFLIHFPVHGVRMKSWRALEKLYKEGAIRAIGVSNYTIRHLEELLTDCEIPPVVNQVEYHPFLNQEDLRLYCQQHNIILEAYSPLAHGERINDLQIAAVAGELGRSTAQVLIRWSLQKGNIVIPKSVREDRIRENFAVWDFEIPEELMQRLDSMNENYRTCWDPTNV